MLIELVDDRSARIDERDDAVMLLRESEEPRVRAVLVRLASDPGEACVVAASAGESLGEIAARIGGMPAHTIASLRPDARGEYAAAYERLRPTADGPPAR